jgi:hypothetical protein
MYSVKMRQGKKSMGGKKRSIEEVCLSCWEAGQSSGGRGDEALGGLL